jgi:hypothetical protein
MGITIHLKGRLRAQASIHELTEEVADYADVLEWTYETFDEPPLTGICVTPHAECETLMLLFDGKGVLRNPVLLGGKYDEFVFVKTQFAGVETHISLCKLLRHLKERYFAELDVNDEGEYWETNDRSLLASRLSAINSVMDSLAEALEHIPKPARGATAGEITGLVEKAAEDVFDETGNARRALLDRVNGPQPPFLYEEGLDWDLERWMEFWQSWDEHRSPALAVLRQKSETLEGIAEALDEGEKLLDEKEKDSLRLMEMYENLPDEAQEWHDDFDASDEEDADADDDADDELSRREIIPEAYALANEWFMKFHALASTQREHLLHRYVYAAVPTAMVGIRMAYLWKKEDDMFLAVPSRLLVSARRFEQTARALRFDAAHRYDRLADEADLVAQALRGEA